MPPRASCLLAVAATVTFCGLAGCSSGREDPLGVTVAAASGNLKAAKPAERWRRKPLSLRVLGRVLEHASDHSRSGGAKTVLPAVVIRWAARGSHPDGVPASTDLATLGDELLRPLTPRDRSPADRGISGR